MIKIFFLVCIYDMHNRSLYNSCSMLTSCSKKACKALTQTYSMSCSQMPLLEHLNRFHFRNHQVDPVLKDTLSCHMLVYIQHHINNLHASLNPKELCMYDHFLMQDVSLANKFHGHYIDQDKLFVDKLHLRIHRSRLSVIYSFVRTLHPWMQIITHA